MIAAALGIDPIELRRRNAVRDGDLVFILAYATGPPIYLRNLWLLKRPASD